MKLHLLLILLLLFTFSSFSQQPASPASLQVKIEALKNGQDYQIILDTLSDYTFVYHRGLVLSDNELKVTLRTAFGFPGVTLNKSTEEYVWSLHLAGENWWFPTDGHSYAITENECLDLGDGQVGNRFRRTRSGSYRHNVDFQFSLTRTNLEKLIKAKSLVIKVRNLTYRIKPEQQKIFKNMLALGTV